MVVKKSSHWHILNLSPSSNQNYVVKGDDNHRQHIHLLIYANIVKQSHSKALWLCSSSMIKSVSDSLKATIDQPQVSSPRKVKTTSKPHGLLLAVHFLIVYPADSLKNCSSLGQSLNTNFPFWQHVHTETKKRNKLRDWIKMFHVQLLQYSNFDGIVASQFAEFGLIQVQPVCRCMVVLGAIIGGLEDIAGRRTLSIVGPWKSLDVEHWYIIPSTETHTAILKTNFNCSKCMPNLSKDAKHRKHLWDLHQAFFDIQCSWLSMNTLRKNGALLSPIITWNGGTLCHHPLLNQLTNNWQTWVEFANWQTIR